MCKTEIFGCGCVSVSLTCKLVDGAQGGKLPGPAGDLVMRKAMTCDQISSLFSPSKGTYLQLESFGVVCSIFIHNFKKSLRSTLMNLKYMYTHIRDKLS